MGDARQAVHFYEASQQYLEVGGADSLEVCAVSSTPSPAMRKAVYHGKAQPSDLVVQRAPVQTLGTGMDEGIAWSAAAFHVRADS